MTEFFIFCHSLIGCVILLFKCYIEVFKTKSFIMLALTPKRVSNLRGPSPPHSARATQLLSKKWCSGGEPLQPCVRFDRPEI